MNRLFTIDPNEKTKHSSIKRIARCNAPPFLRGMCRGPGFQRAQLPARPRWLRRAAAPADRSQYSTGSAQTAATGQSEARHLPVYGRRAIAIGAIHRQAETA